VSRPGSPVSRSTGSSGLMVSATLSPGAPGRETPRPTGRCIITIHDPEEFREELRREGIRTVRRDYIRKAWDDEDIAWYGYVLVLTADKGDTIYRCEVLLCVCPAVIWGVERERRRREKTREEAEAWLRKFFEGFEVRPGVIEA